MPVRPRTSGRTDRGSASVWAVSAAALVLVVAWVAVLRSAAVVARHRAESAADLAALAGAARIGLDGAVCPAARRIAARNGAGLAACSVQLDAGGRSGTVVARVTVPVSLPLVGRQLVTASARAGRLPAAP